MVNISVPPKKSSAVSACPSLIRFCTAAILVLMVSATVASAQTVRVMPFGPKNKVISPGATLTLRAVVTSVEGGPYTYKWILNDVIILQHSLSVSPSNTEQSFSITTPTSVPGNAQFPMSLEVRTPASNTLVTKGFNIILVSGTAGNNAPTTVGSIVPQRLLLSISPQTVDASGNFADPDGDTLTYTANSTDTATATVAISATGVITITPLAVGTAIITVEARDPSGEAAIQSFSVNVSATPRFPSFGNIMIDEQIYTVGTPVDVTLPIASLGDGTLTYSMPPLPEGLGFDPAIRRISGTPTAASARQGYSYAVSDADADHTPADTPSVEVFITVNVVVAAGFADLNTVILPEMARALADQTVSTITQRIDQTRNGGSARSVNIGGQSTLAGAASAHGQAIADGTLSLKDVLGNSDFVLPLSDAGNTGNRMLSSLTFWGGGGYRSLEGSGGEREL